MRSNDEASKRRNDSIHLARRRKRISGIDTRSISSFFRVPVLFYICRSFFEPKKKRVKLKNVRKDIRQHGGTRAPPCIFVHFRLHICVSHNFSKGFEQYEQNKKRNNSNALRHFKTQRESL